MSNIFNTHPLAKLYHELKIHQYVCCVDPTLRRGGLSEGEILLAKDETLKRWSREIVKAIQVETSQREDRVIEMRVEGLALTKDQLQSLLRRAFRLGQQNPHLET